MKNKLNQASLLRVMANDRVWTIGFIVVLLAGAYLRFRGLTFQSYWDDELFSVALSNPDKAVSDVIQATMSDVHPPLYQILLWCWFKIFGYSEIIGRLFPAVFGTLAILLMFLLGQEIADRKTGFIAALICAVNIFHLQYSQEVRSYSLLFFLSSLSLLFFVKIIQRPERRNIIAYVAAATLLTYTHLFGVLIIAAQAIFFLLARMTAGKEFRRTGFIIAIALLLTLSPIIPLILRNAGIGAFFFRPPGPDFAIEYFRGYFGSALIAIAALLALVAGLSSYLQQPVKKDFARLFLLCIALVFTLPYMRSLMATPMLTGRNTIAALPAIFILMAIGLAQIRDAASRAMALIVFTILSVFLISYHPPYYQTVTKPQIRETAEALIAAQPDPELVYAPQEVVNNFNVYLTWLKAPFRVQPVEHLYDSYAEGNGAPIRFWFIDGRVGPIFDQIMRDQRAHEIQRTDYFSAGFMVMELAD